MIKIGKNSWIVYNKDGSLATIEVANRNNNAEKGSFATASILDEEYDNADYSLHWNVWDNKTNMTDAQIRTSIDKKLGIKDYIKLKYKTSIFNSKYEEFLTVGGQLLERGTNEQVINLVYNTICSHFDKNAICWNYRYQPCGFTYCTREQAQQVLKTFEQMEKTQQIEEESLSK